MNKNSKHIIPMSYKSFEEAFKEANRIRSSYSNSEFVVKVVKSPYGGYNVNTIPIDIAMSSFTTSMNYD
jgi:hypothetical protein